MTIVQSTIARDRLAEIEDYWATVSSAKKAARLVDDLASLPQRILNFPVAFPIFYRRALPPPPRAFRVLRYKNYKIIYVLVEERGEVVVVDYWHNARNPDTLLEALDAFVV